MSAEAPASRIGIAGGSCSGKSSLAAALAERWNATVFSLDDYYLDLSGLEQGLREERNFDHPDALDWDKLLAELRELGRYGEAQVPIYDFATHRRAGSRTLEAVGGRLIVEGMFALYRAELRESFALSVFVDLPSTVRLQRRVERDTRERGRTAQSIRKRHASTVEPMYRRFVLPTKGYADLVVDGRRPIAETTQVVAAAAGSI